MNKSNISKVINKMKMFLPLSMLWIGAVTSGYLSDIDLESAATKSDKQKKAPSFFSLFDIFSICCQPTTDKDDLDDKIKKELPLVNPSPLLHLGHLPKESKSNELRDFKQNRSYQGDNGL